MELPPPEIEKYCLEKSSLPSSDCEAIFQHTVKNVPMAQMMIGPLGGSVLGFLVKSIPAKRILEIGCFTGYSSLMMAEQLPADGELITLDINETTTKVAQDFWKKSPHGSKIKLILGPALEGLERVKGPFDFIFIDANKDGYLSYLKKGLTLLSPRGMIALDNCLWDGKVIDPSQNDSETKGIRATNDYIKSQSNLLSCLLPIRDGIMLVRNEAEGKKAK